MYLSSMDEEQPKEEFVIVPKEKLSKEALSALIEEYILREGTDYGHSEKSLEQKKESIMKQLNQKHIQIVFSSLTENCTLIKMN